MSSTPARSWAYDPIPTEALKNKATNMAGMQMRSPPLLRVPNRPVFLPPSRASPPSLPGKARKLQGLSSTPLGASTSGATADPAPEKATGAAAVGILGAADVVREFYEGINRRDLNFVAELIAEDCVYEDLVFSSPFVGRKEILNFFKKFTEHLSSDLQFVIDDISKEDTQRVGVTWHLEWKGRPFPFSKGCSFYKLDVFNEKRQIVYARDVAEPAIKPGDSALAIIRGVTWLFDRFPQLAERM